MVNIRSVDSIWNKYFNEEDLSFWALEFCVFTRDCDDVRCYITSKQDLKLYNEEKNYESLKEYLEILRII